MITSINPIVLVGIDKEGELEAFDEIKIRYQRDASIGA